jgi:hypothetical protein
VNRLAVFLIAWLCGTVAGTLAGMLVAWVQGVPLW